MKAMHHSVMSSTRLPGSIAILLLFLTYWCSSAGADSVGAVNQVPPAKVEVEETASLQIYKTNCGEGIIKIDAENCFGENFEGYSFINPNGRENRQSFMKLTTKFVCGIFTPRARRSSCDLLSEKTVPLFIAITTDFRECPVNSTLNRSNNRCGCSAGLEWNNEDCAALNNPDCKCWPIGTTPTPTPRPTLSPKPTSTPKPTSQPTPGCPDGTFKRIDTKPWPAGPPRGFRCDCASGKQWSDVNSNLWKDGFRCDFGNLTVGASGCQCKEGVSTTATPKPTVTAKPSLTNTPRPSATWAPGPTFTPRPSAAPSPSPTGCPPGTKPVVICEPLSTPAPEPSTGATTTPSPTPTAKPTAAPKPTSMVLWGGGWPVGTCFEVTAGPGSPMQRIWHWPEAYAILPSVALEEWDRTHQICAAETWWSVREEIRRSTTAELADQEIARFEALLDRLLAQRKEAFDRGWPECSKERLHDCAPRKPYIYIGESSSFSWGFYQDLLGGGFYKTDKSGKRVLRPVEEIGPVYWGEGPARFFEGLKRLHAQGKFDGAKTLDVPCVFGWASQIQMQADASLTSFSSAYIDERHHEPVMAMREFPPQWRRSLQVLPPTGAEQIALLSEINPAIWPKGHIWKPNPHSRNLNSPTDDPTDPAVQNRDAFYYTMWLWALRAQFPWVKVVIPQFSNCVQGLLETDHWSREMGGLLPFITKISRFGSGVQIEGCNGRLNREAGRSWNAPMADCGSLRNLQRDPSAHIIQWPGTTLRSLSQDYEKCEG